MTNLEWLRTLSAEGFRDVFFGSKCNRCAYSGPKGCPTKDNGYPDCDGGVLKWLNREHKEELKPCPVCKGKMDIRWQHSGCYLVCEDCGLHYGIDADRADEGIVEGDYRKEEALIDDWNRRVGNGKVDGD